MEFRFLCPLCGQKLKADDDAAGKPFDCPHCGGEFLVPANDPEAVITREAPASGLYSETQGQPLVPSPNADGEQTCPVCWLRFRVALMSH